MPSTTKKIRTANLKDICRSDTLVVYRVHHTVTQFKIPACALGVLTRPSTRYRTNLQTTQTAIIRLPGLLDSLDTYLHNDRGYRQNHPAGTGMCTESSNMLCAIGYQVVYCLLLLRLTLSIPQPPPILLLCLFIAFLVQMAGGFTAATHRFVPQLDHGGRGLYGVQLRAMEYV